MTNQTAERVVPVLAEAVKYLCHRQDLAQNVIRRETYQGTQQRSVDHFEGGYVFLYGTRLSALLLNEGDSPSIYLKSGDEDNVYFVSTSSDRPERRTGGSHINSSQMTSVPIKELRDEQAVQILSAAATVLVKILKAA